MTTIANDMHGMVASTLLHIRRYPRQQAESFRLPARHWRSGQRHQSERRGNATWSTSRGPLGVRNTSSRSGLGLGQFTTSCKSISPFCRHTPYLLSLGLHSPNQARPELSVEAVGRGELSFNTPSGLGRSHGGVWGGGGGVGENIAAPARRPPPNFGPRAVAQNGFLEHFSGPRRGLDAADARRWRHHRGSPKAYICLFCLF